MLPKNLLVPVVVIFLGVVLLLGNMRIIPDQIVSLWPVILVVAGLVGLSSFDMGGKTTTHTSAPKVVKAASKPAAKKAVAKKVAKKKGRK